MFIHPEAGSYVRPGRFDNIFLQAVQNAMTDKARYVNAKRRKGLNFTDAGLERPEGVLSYEANFNDVAGLTHKLVRMLSERLPSRVLETYLLNCEGNENHEIAEMQHIPLGTVKSRIHQARHVADRLRAEFTGYDGAELAGLNRFTGELRETMKQVGR